MELKVADTGSGINKKNLRKLFDPFFTTKNPGKGVGLGLSIAHTIVKAHKGELKVKSKLGKGASFIINFSAL